MNEEALLLSEEDIEDIRRVRDKGPEFWIETILRNPESPAENYKLFYPQKQFFKKNDRKFNYMCIGGKAKIVAGPSLRPIAMEEAPIQGITVTFDFTNNRALWTPYEKVYKGTKPCLKLLLTSGRTITLTVDHLVFSRRHGWVEVGQLQEGDSLLTPKDLPSLENKISNNIEQLFQEYILTNSIPDQVFVSGKAGITEFITKLWAEYGRIIENPHLMRIATPNKKAAEDILFLLNTLGITGSVHPKDSLVIYDPVDITLMMQLLGFNWPTIEVKPGRCWDSIVEIKHTVEQDVYDLIIDTEDHSFWCEGVIVHNCLHRRAGKTYLFAALALYYASMFTNLVVAYYTGSGTQVAQFFDYVDQFIKASPVVNHFLAPKGHLNEPSHKCRMFIGGGRLEGFVVNEGKRGTTADIVFVDEAQGLKDDDWRVVKPIMQGDQTRKHRMRNFISGTVTDAQSEFVQQVFDPKPDVEKSITFVPIDKNLDYTVEEVDAIRRSETPYIFNTEWLLIPTSSSNSVFPIDWLAQCSSPYEYGHHNIDLNKIRVLGIDWDKYQAGSHLLVAQYDTATRKVEVIHTEIVPQTKFTNTQAASRSLDLYLDFQCHFIYCDKGYGETQWELILTAAEERHSLDLDTRCVMVNLGSKFDVPEFQDFTGSAKNNKLMKPFLVTKLRERIQNGLLSYSNLKDDPSDQLDGYRYSVLHRQLSKYTYKIAENDRVKFTNEDEHFVDTLCFIEWCLYQNFENPFAAKDSGEIIKKEYDLNLYSNVEPDQSTDVLSLSLQNFLLDRGNLSNSFNPSTVNWSRLW